MCAVIKQTKLLKSLWCGEWCSKYKYGEVWQTDYITLSQTHQGNHYVLTIVQMATSWLETRPVPHATTQKSFVPWKASLMVTSYIRKNWVRQWDSFSKQPHGAMVQSVCCWLGSHISYHAAAYGEIKWYNGLLQATLKVTGGGIFKHCNIHLAKAMWLVNKSICPSHGGEEWVNSCGVFSCLLGKTATPGWEKTWDPNQLSGSKCWVNVSRISGFLLMFCHFYLALWSMNFEARSGHYDDLLHLPL